MDSRELAFAGAARQAELIRSGEVSPRELVDTYLDRIEALEPRLNAFRVVFAERARAEADQAAARARGGGQDRPLLGVPVAIKDNVDIAGEVTTHGTAGFETPARADSEVVRRLRAAGAILIGKTHLPEFALWPATQSATFGATVNPWHAGYSPGGSSGGSAAAVAAGMAGIAHASDGAGSIRVPASACALFGLKPQRGRVALLPDLEHWKGMSVYGCVSRTVADTALFLDVVAGPAEGSGEPSPPAPSGSFSDAARADAGRLRIAVSTKAAPPGARCDDPILRAVAETADLLRSLGHEVVERDPDFGRAPLQLLFGPRYLRGALEDYERAEHRERIESRTRGLARLGRLIPDAVLARARADAEPWARRVQELWDDVDVLVTPVAPGLPIRLNEQEGRGTARMMAASGPTVAYTTPWNITGQPAASVPAGWTDDGVPLAVQIIGRPNDEATLLTLAAQIERERPWADRLPPLAD